MNIASTLLCAAVLVGSGCGGVSPGDASADLPPPVWCLASRPSVDLVGFDHVVGAHQRTDSTIVVANMYPSEFRFFGPDGARIRTAGRGVLPEQTATVAFLRDDFILAYGADTLYTFRPDGTLQRKVSVELPDGLGFVHELLPYLVDGAFIVSAGDPALSADGLITVREKYLRIDDAGGTVIDTLASVEGPAVAATKGRWHQVQLFPYRQLEGPNRVGDGVFFRFESNATSLRIDRFDGTPVRAFTRPAKPKPVDSARVAAFLATWRARISGDTLRSLIPTMQPAYGGIRVDDVGDLWLLRQSDAGAANLRPFPGFGQPAGAETRWDVMDRDGRAIGRVRMPPRFRPAQMGRDFVLGLYGGTLSEERVQLYSLRRAECEREQGRGQTAPVSSGH